MDAVKRTCGFFLRNFMLIGEFQVFLLTWGNLCDYT